MIYSNSFIPLTDVFSESYDFETIFQFTAGYNWICP